MHVPKFGGVYEIPEDSNLWDEGGYLLVERKIGSGKNAEYSVRAIYRAYDGGLDEVIAGMGEDNLAKIVEYHYSKYDDCFNLRLHKEKPGDPSYSGVTIYNGYPVEKHIIMTAGYSPFDVPVGE